MKVRIQTHVEEVVGRAAALSDVDPAAFTRLAAYRAALETIAGHEFPLLRSIDPEALLMALESPPEPIGRFRLAFETSNRFGRKPADQCATRLRGWLTSYRRPEWNMVNDGDEELAPHLSPE